MADSKVSDLTALAAADVAPANDLLYVIDVSAGASGSKKITVANLFAHSISQPIKAADGNATTPGYSFASDTHTGFYLSANDTLRVATGGTQRAIFTSTGFNIVNSDGNVGGWQFIAGGVSLHNMFAGTAAGANITTGAQNICLGWHAGIALTEGGNNVAIGYEALAAATTPNRNVALGNSAGKALTTGGENMILGSRAMLVATTAAGNVAIGYETLLYQSTGTYCTALGQYAGRYYGAGTGTNGAPTKGVYIGYDTRAANHTQTNEIVIGAEAIGLGSNTAMIGKEGVTNIVGLAGGARFTNAVAAPTHAADCAYVYAADVAAGNCAVHCKTEGGKVIKLFQSAAIADGSDAATTMARLNDLLAHLRLMGIVSAT